MVTNLEKHKNHLSAITAPMLEIVNAKNNEQFLWESGEHGVQRANFINVKTDFVNAKK